MITDLSLPKALISVQMRLKPLEFRTVYYGASMIIRKIKETPLVLGEGTKNVSELKAN